LSLLKSQGITFKDILICPHFAKDDCDCRKPQTTLFKKYINERLYSLKTSVVVGDRQTDLDLAKNLNIRGFKLGADCHWEKICQEVLYSERRSHFERQTKETNILIDVNLDLEGPVRIETGIGFFDHMLDQIGRHAGISLVVKAQGDLQVDQHHTVEDVGIGLGVALKQALGEKRGIERYGCLIPMDESLATVALDLSGRFYFNFEGNFPDSTVGQLPTSLIKHFFRSLAQELGATLHMTVKGEDSHHMVEGLFKGFARSLRQAIARHDQLSSSIPSTKGIL
ncbi:MAG: imidazoleglycerol-phosphate dehydratase HisB, partial [Pseudomonadota bacterium]